MDKFELKTFFEELEYFCKCWDIEFRILKDEDGKPKVRSNEDIVGQLVLTDIFGVFRVTQDINTKQNKIQYIEHETF